jgi:multiple RNA-binding domain-containing protein 1
VRMPKKFDGKHRGFAFVEYLSKQDAAKAMEALGNTHLYGRHLVLEWAADEQSMDALRDKAKRNLDASQKASDAKRLRAANAADESDVKFDQDGDAGMADQMLTY